jgi:hypothetical protein
VSVREKDDPALYTKIQEQLFYASTICCQIALRLASRKVLRLSTNTLCGH